MKLKFKVGDIGYLKDCENDYDGYFVVREVVINSKTGYRIEFFTDVNYHAAADIITWYGHELVKVDTDMTVEEYKFYLQL